MLPLVVAWIVLAPSARAPVALAATLGAALVVQGLEPFVLRPATASFAWVPFSDFLNGAMYHNALVIVEKTFLYGSLIYLLHAAGLG